MLNEPINKWLNRLTIFRKDLEKLILTFSGQALSTTFKKRHHPDQGRSILKHIELRLKLFGQDFSAFSHIRHLYIYTLEDD